MKEDTSHIVPLDEWRYIDFGEMKVYSYNHLAKHWSSTPLEVQGGRLMVRDTGCGWLPAGANFQSLYDHWISYITEKEFLTQTPPIYTDSGGG